jgi:hypothetical protein
MVVTEFGRVTDVKLEQFLKAPSTMLVIEFGRLIEDKLEQSLNALLPMLVIEFGRVTEVILVYSKAYSLIPVTA